MTNLLDTLIPSFQAAILQFDLSQPEQRGRCSRMLIAAVASKDDPLLRREYGVWISRRFGLDESTVQEYIRMERVRRGPCVGG